jgi:hypothetical protein
MKPRANQFGHLQVHRSATPVFIGSLRSMTEGRLSMRVSGRSCFSLAARSCGFLSSAQPSVAVQFRLGLLATQFHLALVLAQRLAASPVVRFAQALSQHPSHVTVAVIRHSEHQRHTVKTAPSSSQCSNPALNLAPFGRWTLRDKAAQRRLALRYAS